MDDGATCACKLHTGAEIEKLGKQRHLDIFGAMSGLPSEIHENGIYNPDLCRKKNVDFHTS